MCKRNIDHLLLECSQLGTWPTTQAYALTGNQTSNLLVCRPTHSPINHTVRTMIIFIFSEYVMICVLTILHCLVLKMSYTFYFVGFQFLC